MKLDITREWLAAALAGGEDSDCAAADPTFFQEQTMSTTMRAKMRVTFVQDLHHGVDGAKNGETLTLAAVYPKSAYPEDGRDENHSYARWTPQADFRMTVQNPALFGQFKAGDEFYVDFTRAEQ